MAIPDGVFSTTPVESALLSPDGYERFDLLEDFERGGVAINDPTQGYDVRDWRAWSDGTTVWVAPLPGLFPITEVHSGVGITEISLAFDQNMAPTVAFVEAGLVKLRWYDSLIEGMTTTSYPGARSPMVCLDDKRQIASQTNDIIFAYVRDEQVRYRQQRDRFGVEYTLGATPSPGSRIVGLGMGVNWRLQVKLTVSPTARHLDRATDTLYLVTGEDLVQLGAGPVETARWQSRIFVANEVPVMGWARVDGDYPLTLRVYGDGALVFASSPITSPEPFRLPAGRWREWSVELEGAVRGVSLGLAQSLEELQ